MSLELAPEVASDWASDLSRGRYDVPFFAERFLGIRLHAGQIRFAEAYVARNRARPWTPAFLNIYVSAGNRAGKTLVLAIIVFHSCFYKMGLEIPLSDAEYKGWLQHKYDWYHLAISQELAYLVYYELLQILAGVHVAQNLNGCPLTAAIPDIAQTDQKWAGQWYFIRLSEALGGATIHFRTTAEKATGTLGRDMNGISVDEAGFEAHLEYVIKEVLHLRRLGTGGPLILITTPTADVIDFADFWNTGDPENPDRNPRSYSIRISTRENVGFGLDRETFDSLVAGMSEDEIAQNIDGRFVQAKLTYFNAKSVDRAFVETVKGPDGTFTPLPEFTPAQNGHEYVQGVDPALTYDAMWSIVLDITDPDHWFGVKIGYLTGRRTSDDLTDLTIDHFNAYNVNRRGLQSRCSLGADVTGMGGKMFRENLVNAGVFDIRNIEFGGQSATRGKKKILADLRGVIDTGRLKMPRTGPWLTLRKQLLRYRTDVSKPDDDGIAALGCAVQEGMRYAGRGTPQPSVPFDARLDETPYAHAGYTRLPGR